MNIEEIKMKVGELAGELGCNPEKISVLVGNVTGESFEKALNGEDSEALGRIEKFFVSRDSAFAKYSDEQCGLIRQLEKRAISCGSISKALENSGISPSAISGIRTGTYKGVADNVFSKISSFFRLKDENSKVYKHENYVPTSISESIFQNIRTAHIQGVCVMITGDAGIGKSEAAKHYHTENPEDSAIITAIEPKTTKTAMLEMLAAELGTDLSGTRRAVYSQKILSELHDGTVIIVDEAQNFRFDAIDTLRGFADYFRNKNLGTVGIVCMGNDTFRQQFFGKSGIGKEQVWNRFVERPTYQTTDIRFSDIELLFPELAKKGMRDELRFLYGIALSPKEDIRSAVHLYTSVYNRHGGKCTIEMLSKQAKRMQIDVTNIDTVMKRLRGVK